MEGEVELYPNFLNSEMEVKSCQKSRCVDSYRMSESCGRSCAGALVGEACVTACYPVLPCFTVCYSVALNNQNISCAVPLVGEACVPT